MRTFVNQATALLRRFWHDDRGAILASEWVLVVTILVIGVLPALVAYRQAVLTELEELANSLLGLDQSYSFSGQTLLCAGNRGWAFRTANGTVRGDEPRGLPPPTLPPSRSWNGQPGWPWDWRQGQAWTAGSGAVDANHLDDDRTLPRERTGLEIRSNAALPQRIGHLPERDTPADGIVD